MTTPKRFAVFDSDSRVVEPRDVWEEYLEPEYRVLGKHALWREEGKTNSYLKVNGEIYRDPMHSTIPRHAIWRPGMTWDAIGELGPQTRHAMNEGAWEPQARLRDMDAMGVDQALLYPTWFAEGFHLVHDPLWAELERLGMTAAVHPTPGLWNPEWTSHGPFFEKIRGRLHQAPLIGGSVGPFAGGGSGLQGAAFFAGTVPHGFAAKVVWGSRYPHHDTTSAWDAIAMLTRANVAASLMARMMGGNAAHQFGITPVQTVSA